MEIDSVGGSTHTEKDDVAMMDSVKTEGIEVKANVTCHREPEVTLASFCKQVFFSEAANPFPDQTPYEMLTRQYKLAEIAITPGFVSHQIRMPANLLVNPQIINALRFWKYFRAGMKMTLKISSTIYQAGSLLISFIHDIQGVYTFPSIMEASAMHPIVMNISSSDVCEITYDWLAPQLYMETTETGSATIGIMNIMPLVAINNPTGSTTATLGVYAQFTDIKTAGFLHEGETLRVEGQSSFVASTTSVTATAEQKDKSETGLSLLSIGRLARPIFRSFPATREVYDALAGLVKSVAEIMDKPRSLKEATRVISAPFTDFANGSGLDLSDRLSLYPVGNLGTPPLDTKCMSTSHTVNQLAQIPMLHYKRTFTVVQGFSLGVHPMFQGTYNEIVSPRSVRPDYLMYAAMGHLMWRGSIKYMIQFVTNGFTTAKFRISYCQSNVAVPEETGDIPNRVIDVKGSMTETIIIPFLSPTVWKNVPLLFPGDSGYDAFTIPRLFIEMITSPSGLGEGLQIDVIVWRAGGPDTMFQGVHTVQNFPEPTRVEGQCSIQEVFKQDFKSLGCKVKMAVEAGYTSSEVTGRIVDIMRRYYPVDWTASINNNNPITMQIPLFWWGNLFRYQRGSLRIKLMVITHGDVPILGLDSASGATIDLSRGFTGLDTSHLMGAEIPYYAILPYQATDNNSSAFQYEQYTQMKTVNVTTAETFMSVGDDFYMFYLLPPKVISKYIAPEKKHEKKAASSKVKQLDTT